jgi:hypothetical protein
MNIHSREILNRALIIIKRYRNNEIGLAYLVNSLEGSLTALEEQMPEEFLEKWFSYWGDLEIILSLEEEKQAQNAIYNDLQGLENLISGLLTHY